MRDPPVAGQNQQTLLVAIKEHEHKLSACNDCMKANADIKAQIMAAVNPTYYRTSRDKKLGCHKVTPKILLDHLTKEYAKLSAKALEDNRNRLADEWTPELNINKLFEKIDDIKEIAEEGDDPIKNSTVIELTFPELTLFPVILNNRRRVTRNMNHPSRMLAELRFKAAFTVINIIASDNGISYSIPLC